TIPTAWSFVNSVISTPPERYRFIPILNIDRNEKSFNNILTATSSVLGQLAPGTTRTALVIRPIRGYFKAVGRLADIIIYSAI
ncbi:MAG: hypothetical protein ACC669_02660, partial [bacterium]